MDFLIIIAMSILTPFYLNISNTDYKTSLGLAVTNNNATLPFSRYSGKSILTGKNDTKIISTSYSGDNKFAYEFALQYTIPTSFFDNKLSFGTKTAWAPIQERINVTSQGLTSPRPSTSQVYFYEMPSFGFFVDFDLFKEKSLKIISSSITPYISTDLMRVGYAGSDNYDKEVLYDNVMKFSYGVKFKNKSGWNLFVENSIYSISFLYIEGSKQNFNLTVSKFKIGASYTFLDQIHKARLKKDSNYEDILNIINPNINEIKRQEEEETRQKLIEEEAIISQQKTIAAAEDEEAKKNEAAAAQKVPTRKNPTIRENRNSGTIVITPENSLPEEIKPEGDFLDWNF